MKESAFILPLSNTEEVGIDRELRLENSDATWRK